MSRALFVDTFFRITRLRLVIRHTALWRIGVYANQRLDFGGVRRDGTLGKAEIANRTREIRPYGMKRGACGNVGYREGLLRWRNGNAGKPCQHLRLRASHFYPEWGDGLTAE